METREIENQIKTLQKLLEIKKNKQAREYRQLQGMKYKKDQRSTIRFENLCSIRRSAIRFHDTLSKDDLGLECWRLNKESELRIIDSCIEIAESRLYNKPFKTWYFSSGLYSSYLSIPTFLIEDHEADILRTNWQHVIKGVRNF